MTQSAYQCLEPISGRIYTSRHVRFNETEYPFPTMTKPKVPSQPDPAPTYDPLPFTIVPHTAPLVKSSPQPSGNQSPCGHPSPQQQQQTTPTNVAPPSAPTQNLQPAETSTVNEAPQAEPRHSMTTRSRNNIVKPVQRYNLTAHLQTDPHWIPSTWQQAMKHAHW